MKFPGPIASGYTTYAGSSFMHACMASTIPIVIITPAQQHRRVCPRMHALETSIKVATVVKFSSIKSVDSVVNVQSHESDNALLDLDGLHGMHGALATCNIIQSMYTTPMLHHAPMQRSKVHTLPCGLCEKCNIFAEQPHIYPTLLQLYTQLILNMLDQSYSATQINCHTNSSNICGGPIISPCHACTYRYMHGNNINLGL